MHPFMALKPLFLTCACLILLGCKNTPTEVKVEQLLKADSPGMGRLIAIRTPSRNSPWSRSRSRPTPR